MKINSEATLPDIVYATHPYRWVVLAGVWLAYACFGMTVASLAPLMQPITRDLAISHSAMGAVLGVWPLVYIAAAAACGALTDRMGPRRRDRQINPAAKSEGLAGAPQSGA